MPQGAASNAGSQAGQTSQGSNTGLISGIVSGAQAVGSFFGNMGRNKKARKWAAKMYEKQKRDNLAFWNMQNQYNSPVMEMQRLKEAGLNPNLAYGQLGQSAAGNIESPSQKMPEPDNVMPERNFMMDLYNMKQINAQTDLTRQQIQNQIANERLTTITTALQSLAVTAKTTENEFLRKKLENEQAKLMADIGYTRQQTRTSSAVEDKTRQDIENSISEINMKAESQNWSIKQVAQNIAESIKRMSKMNAEMGLIKSNTRLADAKKIEQDLINDFAKQGIRIGENVQSAAIKKVFGSLTDLLKWSFDNYFIIPNK